MTEQQLQAALKIGQFKTVQVQPRTQPQPQQSPQTPLIDFLSVLTALRLLKKHLTTAPTLTPKNFLDQIQFYDDGTHQRVYFYVNNTWHYATLT